MRRNSKAMGTTRGQRSYDAVVMGILVSSTMMDSKLAGSALGTGWLAVWRFTFPASVPRHLCGSTGSLGTVSPRTSTWGLGSTGQDWLEEKE